MTGSALLLAAGDPMEHVIPHKLFDLGPLHFTNHMLMLLVAAAIMLIVFPRLARNYPLVPSGFRNMIEAVMVFLRKEVAKPALHAHTGRFLPFIWTLFFFILINNLLGMVPLDPLAVLILGRGHLAGTATAGLSVTAGLAAVAFIMIHVSGIMEQYHVALRQGKSVGGAAFRGFFMYWYNFVPHIPGVLGAILWLPLFVLEMIGAAVKPFALAVRLFANMMAGHTVLASLLMMIPAIRHASDVGIAIPTLLGCAALGCLELFVAFLQAYIFVFLTCMFIGAAVSPEH